MDLKQVAKDTAKVLTSYLTYQAMRTVMSQISETNPPLALWLHSFTGNNSVQDGEVYIQTLLGENQELAFRIMTVREHLAEEVAEFLPEMVRTSIQQANMKHRRQHLERITQLTFTEPTIHPEQQPDSESNLGD